MEVDTYNMYLYDFKIISALFVQISLHNYRHCINSILWNFTAQNGLTDPSYPARAQENSSLF